MPDDIPEDEGKVAAFEEDDDDAGLPATGEIGDVGKEPEAKQEAKAADDNPVIAKLMEQIEDLKGGLSRREEREAELQAELSILRNTTATQRQEIVEETDFSPEEKQQILAVMAKDPIAAIRKILDHGIEQNNRRVSREIDSRVSNTARGVEAARVDQDMVHNFFPEIRENEAFAQRTTQLHRLIINEAGKGFPGSFYLAAAAAKAEMERKGTWKSATTNGKATTDTSEPLTLREKVRQNADRLIDERPPERKTNGFDPSTEYSEAELRGVRAACKRYGITEKQYFARFAEQRKRDSNYGRR